MRASLQYCSRKGVRWHCWDTGAKGEGHTWGWGNGVSLSERRARCGGGTRHFYLCCADSARLSLQEADEEEWPHGRTNWAHLYLSSSSDFRAAESAAPPHPPPTMNLEMTCLPWPDTLSVCKPERSSSVCGVPLPLLNPVRHGSMSASLSPALNTGLHSSSSPELVTVAISQRERGGKKEVGKNSE